MPKLHMVIKKKKETYGMTRHEAYSVVIPYEISQDLSLNNSMKLYSSVSHKTGIIRLHVKPHREMTPILVRQTLTKTYKNQRYHSTKISIPIKFIKELNLKKGDNLNITQSNHSIVIKKQNRN